MLLLLIAGAALGFAVWAVVGRPFGRDPVTKAEIEREVAKRPRGHVESVFCNEQFVPSQTSSGKPRQTWTCDTYIGPTLAKAQGGPSYRVIVSDDRIRSIRRVPTH